jgi:hypothetical protein
MFFKIKKYLFLDDILNMCSLICFFLFNQFNFLFFKIQYLDLHLSLGFSGFVLSIINDFLLIY